MSHEQPSPAMPDQRIRLLTNIEGDLDRSSYGRSSVARVTVARRKGGRHLRRYYFRRRLIRDHHHRY